MFVFFRKFGLLFFLKYPFWDSPFSFSDPWKYAPALGSTLDTFSYLLLPVFFVASLSHFTTSATDLMFFALKHFYLHSSHFFFICDYDESSITLIKIFLYAYFHRLRLWTTDIIVTRPLFYHVYWRVTKYKVIADLLNMYSIHFEQVLLISTTSNYFF